MTLYRHQDEVTIFHDDVLIALKEYVETRLHLSVARVSWVYDMDDKIRYVALLEPTTPPAPPPPMNLYKVLLKRQSGETQEYYIARDDWHSTKTTFAVYNHVGMKYPILIKRENVLGVTTGQ
jgi:hypothetical protein